jgi:hypothetical protein
MPKSTGKFSGPGVMVWRVCRNDTFIGGQMIDGIISGQYRIPQHTFISSNLIQQRRKIYKRALAVGCKCFIQITIAICTGVDMSIFRIENMTNRPIINLFSLVPIVFITSVQVKETGKVSHRIVRQGILALTRRFT